MQFSSRRTGFSLIELIVAISVLGILAGITVIAFPSYVERTRMGRAELELSQLANAAKQYAVRYNAYPPDVGVGIPSELNEFIDASNYNNDWPTGPWPGSLYDYESWDIAKPNPLNSSQMIFGQDGVIDTWQVSIRFCDITESNGFTGSDLCRSRMPREPWATSWNSVSNSVYYCIKGYCRAHDIYTLYNDGKGYGVNTPNHAGIATADNK